MNWLMEYLLSPNLLSSKSVSRNKHDLFDRVLATILKSGQQGVFQTEICKEFSLDSRDGSRLAGNLEKQSLISREKVLHKGRWTYKLIIKKSAMAETSKKRHVQIASVEGAPCLSCSYQHSCSSEDEMTQYSPSKCSWLEEWVITNFNKIGVDASPKSLMNMTEEKILGNELEIS
jgi:DNA-binding MarR family transcriptional regulator